MGDFVMKKMSLHFTPSYTQSYSLETISLFDYSSFINSQHNMLISPNLLLY